MSRTKKYTTGFTTLPNDLLNDESISFKAKGIYAFLNSKPDGWEFSIDRISLQTLEGRDSIRAGIVELEKAELLTRTPLKNSDLQFCGYQYNLFDYKPSHGRPDDGGAVDGKPDDGKPDDIVIKKEQERISKKEAGRASDTFSYLEIIKNNPTYEMLRSKKFPDLSDDDIEIELLLIGERYKYKRADFTTIINWLANVNGKQMKYSPQIKNKGSNSSVQESNDRYIALHAENFYKVAFMTSKEIEAGYDGIKCKYFIGTTEVTRQECINEIIRLNSR